MGTYRLVQKPFFVSETLNILKTVNNESLSEDLDGWGQEKGKTQSSVQCIMLTNFR
jgi:hypothetical protein